MPVGGVGYRSDYEYQPRDEVSDIYSLDEPELCPQRQKDQYDRHEKYPRQAQHIGQVPW